METAGNRPGIVRGEKEWQAWAQDLEDWGNQQTNVANRRLPYASTLQLAEEPAKAAAATRPAGPVRGEKQWQAWAGDQEDYAADATKAANTRLPYASTLQMSNFVQTRDEENADEKDDDSSDDEVAVDVAGEKFSNEKVPLDFHFVHIENDDGELVKMEVNEGIPLNFRF